MRRPGGQLRAGATRGAPATRPRAAARLGSHRRCQTAATEPGAPALPPRHCRRRRLAQRGPPGGHPGSRTTEPQPASPWACPSRSSEPPGGPAARGRAAAARSSLRHGAQWSESRKRGAEDGWVGVCAHVGRGSRGRGCGSRGVVRERVPERRTAQCRRRRHVTRAKVRGRHSSWERPTNCRPHQPAMQNQQGTRGEGRRENAGDPQAVVSASARPGRAQLRASR